MAIAPKYVHSPGAGDRAFADGDAPRLRDGSQLWLHAADPAERSAERVALAVVDARDRTVGRASYERVYGPRAVVTLDVDDDLAHSELREVLLAALCVRAARCGITVLLARVPASDLQLLALLRERFHARETRDGRHVQVELRTAGPARLISEG